MKVLLLMAGDSSLFHEAGYRYPKNLVEVGGLPVVQRVVESVLPLLARNEDLICMVREDEDRRYHTGNVVRLIAPGAVVVPVHGETQGSACTALLAIEQVDPDDSVLVVNGDVLMLCDVPSIVESFEDRDLDGGIIVFDGVHPRWSYVKTDDAGLVIEAAEKRPISRWATVGVYYFKRAADFIGGAMDMIRKDAQVDGKFYICPIYNELILRQLRSGVSSVERSDWFSLATPQGVQLLEKSLHSKGGG